MKDFFISYNKADASWAEWIAWQLDQAGHSVVIQAWDFRPGSNFILEMQKAASECERTLAVFSPDYLTSLFTAPEWAAALLRDPTGKDRILVPVVVRECRPEGLLGPIVQIRINGLDETAARDRVLDGLKPSGKPSKAPGFPGALRKPGRFPGAPPRIWNVPAKNPNFTGREEDLSKIRQKLLFSKSTAVTAAGAGGIGKTTLANEYAHRYATDYDLVWWMRAEEKPPLAEDFVTLAAKLGIEAKDAVLATRDWLRQNGGWLVVFDNATGPDDYAEYLPEGPGHLLVTSRNLNWPDSVDLPVLPRAEAVQFLQERSGKKDADAADKLCDALGDLPLALELAAAYIRETSISIRSYLDDFGTYVSDVAASIAKRIEPSIKRLETESPTSIALLSLAAFYAPDDIPKFLLKSVIAGVKEFNAAIAGLRRFALVTADEDTISIHRLIQRATRDRLDDCAKWVKDSLILVSRRFPFEQLDVETWEPSARLLPHALEAANHAERLGLLPELAGALLNRVSLYLHEVVARRDAAAEVMSRALSLAKLAYGPTHPRVATALVNMGIAALKAGDRPKARTFVEEALRIYDDAPAADIGATAHAAASFCAIFRELGELDEAQRMGERAVALSEQRYGANDRLVALSCSNLGMVLIAKGDCVGARALFERSLVIAETGAPNSPRIATICNNLAGALAELGEFDLALNFQRRAFEAAGRAYGQEHPTTKNIAAGLRTLEARRNL